MRRYATHRQRGQTIVIAAVAMVAVIGSVAMVIDAGMFFIVQRQLQSAADAGALAGAFYDPVCTVGATQCYPSCPSGPSSCPPGAVNEAIPVATSVARVNAAGIAPLCGGSIPTVSVYVPGQLVTIHVTTIVVTVECDAGYSFGRILGLTTKHIGASAAAATGDRTANGDMTDFTFNPTPCPPDKCRIARLIE